MSWTQERARLARLHQTHTADSPEIAKARRDLRAARLEEHVAKIVDQAPPLTVEQRARIVGLLSADRPQHNHADLGLPASSDCEVGDD